MKLAVLGGSFNPVHVGHLFLADAVLTSLGYDRIILVPTYQSPLKIGAEGASPSDRMEMLTASISGDPRLTTDDCEIRRQGVSFTIDTLGDIITRYRPEGKLGLILGDDLASTFDKWLRPAEIAELTDIIIAKRLAGPETGAFPYPCKVLDNEIITISSQTVREKIRNGENWRYLVPPGARFIIEDRHLYGINGDSETAGEERTGLAEITARIENDVRAILPPSRFLHSRNTALLAWDLCLRFGQDAQKGYLAGIAHDICKNHGEAELIRLAHADGGGSSKLEKGKPSLLHARAGAVLLRKNYRIDDQDILDAIRYHTTGTRDMCPLAKIVYIADKIEVSRIGLESSLRKMAASADLDVLFAAVLDNTVAHLKSRQLDLSYGTKRLLTAMHKRNKLL